MGNPVRTSSGFLTPILNENNNTVDNIKISLSRNVRSEWVTDHTAKVISNVLFKSFNFSANVSSAYRTPEKQARAMYYNLIGAGEGQGVRAQRNLYLKPGNEVIDIFEAFSPEWNCTSAECIAAMTNKINEIGPGNVSTHSSNPSTYNVIDISPKSITNTGYFKEEVKKVTGKDQPIKHFIPYPKDPGHHLEIPQPQKTTLR
ncbi:MAG: hypothetical protein JKY33_06510 [Bacteroidia bacterium]|nr:hypothetical protein [Bacteroidia bacterium]